MPVATRSSLITCGDYSECAMQIAFLVVWVGHGAGMQCSLAPLFQFSTVAYSRKIQWPICNFYCPVRLACVPKPTVSVPYCT